MKKILVVALMLLSVTAFSTNRVTYDESKDNIVNVVDSETKSLLATVDLIQVEAIYLSNDKNVTVSKIDFNKDFYFVAIKTEFTNKDYVYCSNKIPIIKHKSRTSKYNIKVKSKNGSSGGVPRNQMLSEQI